MEECRALVRARPRVEDLMMEIEKSGTRPEERVG